MTRSLLPWNMTSLASLALRSVSAKTERGASRTIRMMRSKLAPSSGTSGAGGSGVLRGWKTLRSFGNLPTSGK
ncbi:hypothetical protein AJ87_15960 [Rhizobium yanglingense]|nr:hypothetical protein AJ87_15960 [Rhizobium yanglingense]